MTSLKIAAAAALSMLFGCGQECKNEERTYDVSEVTYSAEYEEPEAYGLPLYAVNGSIELRKHRPGEYYPPNKYVAVCSSGLHDRVFEFYMTRIIKDGNYELIGFNAANDKASLESKVMDAEELEETAEILCGIFIPYKIIGDGEYQRIQERKTVGHVSAKVEQTGTECLDYYYEDKYLEEDDF